MKNVLLFASVVILFFTTSCEKQESVAPELPLPTVTFKKSTAYADQTVTTPETSVLLFEATVILENGPISIISTVTLTSTDSLAVKYSALKNMYMTITGVAGVSNKKNPVQSGVTFDPTGVNQNGTHTLRVYAQAPAKFVNSIMTVVELSYEYKNPNTKAMLINSAGSVKGQTITFK
ncbi:MAG: hypothetical protein ACOYMZ_03290 [Minisyncoccia bacterium]